MLSITREGSRLIVAISTSLANGDGRTATFVLAHDCGHACYADAVLRHAKHEADVRMRLIRQGAYAQGWRDAKAKKAGQETWFSGELP